MNKSLQIVPIGNPRWPPPHDIINVGSYKNIKEETINLNQTVNEPQQNLVFDTNSSFHERWLIYSPTISKKNKIKLTNKQTKQRINKLIDGSKINA
jgi:translation elongation factor EF-G